MRMKTCGSLENHSSISSNESVAAAQSVSIASSSSPLALASVSMISVSQQRSITCSAPQSAMQQPESAGARQVPAAECNANESSGRTNGLLNLFHDQDTCEFKNYHLDSSSLQKFISLTSFFQFLIADEDETEVFQIQRKLLRRRHVRKEQIQRGRERAAAKRAEKHEEDRRKRKREQQLVEKGSNSGPSGPSSFESSSPKEESGFPRMNDVYPQQPAGVRMLVSPPPRLPTGVMVPAFSPLRPSKRRNTQYC